MLSNLLSSKYKSGVVNLFLAHPGRAFAPAEIKASTACPNKVLVQTLKELMKLGFLMTVERSKIKFYKVDKHFALYPELVAMLRKNKKLPQDLLVKELAKLSDCKVVILTGVFVGKPRIESDILLVGKVTEKRLANTIKLAEKFAEHQVNYTIMPMAEFDYRKIMSDRFLKNVLENHPLVVTDKTKNKSVVKLVNRP
jgi:hypothetical protein